MRTHRDLVFAERDSGPLHLDLYLPDGDGPHPLLLVVHGGAWIAGDRTQVGEVRRQTDRGWAVASIDYRLADVAPHPAQIRDCRAALRWLGGRAGEFDLDPDRVVAQGFSAGGHLVALLGTAPDADFGPRDVAPAESNRVDGVVAFFPVTDLPTANATAADDAEEPAPESKLVGGPIRERPDVARDASPITYVDGDEPPFLVVHGSADDVVPREQSDRLVRALADANDAVTYHIVAGGGQGGFEDPAIAPLVDGFLDRRR